MKTNFDQRVYNEFPPMNAKWRFSEGGIVSDNIRLSHAIGLARISMHTDGYSLAQQDRVLAIAGNQCVLHGVFVTGITKGSTMVKQWEIRYIMSHTDTVYPPYGTWRLKYGKLPELPQ